MDVTPTLDQFLVNYLRESLRFSDPNIVSDPVYQYTDNELWSIIWNVVPAFDPNYSITTLPAKYYPGIMILARKEVFWRLAVSTAPYYKLEAEGASLEKNMRFDHYTKLIFYAIREWDNWLETIGGSGVVETYEVTTKNYHYSKANYAKSFKPTVIITLSDITATTVNVDWTRFDAKNGMFFAYKLYWSTSQIVDPYAETPIPTDAKYVSNDMQRTQYRVTGLLPNTTYHLAVVSVDRNTTYGYAETTFTTLPSS